MVTASASPPGNSPIRSYKLAVSIVLFHSPIDLLQATCRSLVDAVARARSRGYLGHCTLLLVDHSGSVDYQATVAEMLETTMPRGEIEWQLLASDSNRGYGHGHNQLAVEQDTLRLILNPDVELANDALCAGISHFDTNDSAVLASPFVASEDGFQEFLCKRYPSVWVLLLRAFAPRRVKNWFSDTLANYEARDLCCGDRAVPVPLASGCFMLVRGDSLAHVRGFDERYFLYFEDFDLSLRLADCGELHYVPSMRIVHHGGNAARKGWRHIAMFLRSGIRFFHQYGWRWA
ncbi:MAG: glycosyltransferase family 2 protein [Pseudomonadota bacterium]